MLQVYEGVPDRYRTLSGKVHNESAQGPDPSERG